MNRFENFAVIDLVKIAVLLVCCPLTCGGAQPKCYGEFDVYFILDKSSSVPEQNFQFETVNFVENITNSFKSPKSGISFITFSGQGLESVVLKLTRDRKQISKGLADLRKVKPNGKTYLAGALKKTNEQFLQFGKKRASVILVVTDGSLYDIDPSVAEADRARSLGASVVTVGVGAFQIRQLKKLANTPSEQYVYTSKNFASLNTHIYKIVEKSCIEILSVSPVKVCAGAPYSVALSGHGFTKTDNISKVICGYRFNDTYRTVQKASVVKDNRLVCPGFMFNQTDRTFIVEMSANEGLTFVSSNVTISTKYCAPPTVPGSPTSPAARIPDDRVNVGLALFFVFFFLFLIGFLIWWFLPLICKPKPKPPKYKPAPPVPPPPETKKGPGKTKWPTVDASYYGGGGVGGIAPVRVDWGDKGSTEAGSKLAKAKGGKTKDSPEDTEKLTGGGSGASGGGGGSPGCMAVARARMAGYLTGCLAAMSRVYQRIASYRPRPGGNLFYSTPDAHA